MPKVKRPDTSRLIDLPSSKITHQNELIKQLADNTPVMIWISGPDRQLNFFNNSWLEFTGQTNKQKPVHNWTAVVHPDDQKTYLDLFTKCFDERKSFNAEYRLRRNDGKYRWILNIAKPIVVKEVFMGYIGTCIDIQEQKDATRELQETVLNIQLVLDSLPNVAWRNNLKGKAVYSNRHWFDLTGQTTDELIKYGPRSFVHPDDYKKVDKLWAIHALSGQPMETEIRYLRASDKTYRWHLVRAVPVRNKEGEIFSWISNGTDINEQKQFASALEQRVEERTKALLEANLSLERSNNDLQQFAYVASHDLQEPLRKIILYSGRIKSDYHEGSQVKIDRDIDRVVNSASLVMQLINDLQNFSQLSDKSIGFADVNLNLIIKKVLIDFVETITLRNANVTYQPLPVIEAIEPQMKLLFHHLISNALKFCTDEVSPEISITARILHKNEVAEYQILNNKGTYYELCFRDNGIGFEQKMAEKIFIIFQRLHSKSEFPGTGIGLALCGKIVHNHNGIIYAKSEKNKGAAFYVILPALQKQA